MTLSWDEFKKRRQAELGTDAETIKIVQPARRRAAPKPAHEPDAKLFDVWKISLPPGINRIVLIGVTEKEARWWIEKKLKARTFEDDTQNLKTLIFYEMFPQGVAPSERNIYANPARFCTEDFPGFNNPRKD